jgi:uncharacterized protein (DUF1697 family)
VAHAVLLRAANVGGRNVFRPAELARTLRRLDVASIGAAGTFAVRADGKGATAVAVARAFRAALDFDAELFVLPGAEVQALVASRPFGGQAFSKDLRGWVAALAAAPARIPKLPIEVPARGAWSVSIERVQGRFALGLWRRRARGFVFPNQVVEDALGVRATTRWLETFEKLAAACGA